MMNSNRDHIITQNNRYFLVQKAKDADTIGIVVGTLGVGRLIRNKVFYLVY
jgi:diphthamide biosynthesis enzyme Dph1/Dph2-like protein